MSSLAEMIERAAHWLLSLSLLLSLLCSLRKCSTGDGPREVELEDLREDEPSSWVLMTLPSTHLCLQPHPLHVSVPEPLCTHPVVQTFPSNQSHHGRIILYTEETRGFQSDMSLVLKFRCVCSGLLSILLPVRLRVCFLTPLFLL